MSRNSSIFFCKKYGFCAVCLVYHDIFKNTRGKTGFSLSRFLRIPVHRAGPVRRAAPAPTILDHFPGAARSKAGFSLLFFNIQSLPDSVSAHPARTAAVQIRSPPACPCSSGCSSAVLPLRDTHPRSQAPLPHSCQPV